MSVERRVQVAYVALVLVAALLLLARVVVGPNNSWSLECFAFLGLCVLLDAERSKLKHGVTGSANFVVYSAAALVFGPGVAAILTACASTIGSLFQRSSGLRIAFNAAQHTIAVVVGYAAYSLIAGGAAQSLLSSGALSWYGAARECLAFVAFTAVYLTINSVLVSAAVAISGNKNFLEIWYSNNKGIVSYDLSSSALGVLLVVAFSFSTLRLGVGYPGVLLAGMPMLVARRSYALFRELQASSEEHLQLMVRAIEARDPYTSGHSLRVQRLSMAIAKDLQIGGVALREVEIASLLHDVGKIHEEFAPILRKEGKLTPEERALMESHAERGAEIVGVVSRFRGAVQAAVRHHHERWDGQGYPDRLAGVKIPLASRIILVADTIDAMTTDRPYRSRMSFESVVNELKRFSGVQFDPEIAECAISSLSVRRIISEGHETEQRTMPAASSVSAPVSGSAVQ